MGAMAAGYGLLWLWLRLGQRGTNPQDLLLMGVLPFNGLLCPLVQVVEVLPGQRA